MRGEGAGWLPVSAASSTCSFIRARTDSGPQSLLLPVRLKFRRLRLREPRESRFHPGLLLSGVLGSFGSCVASYAHFCACSYFAVFHLD